MLNQLSTSFIGKLDNTPKGFGKLPLKKSGEIGRWAIQKCRCHWMWSRAALGLIRLSVQVPGEDVRALWDPQQAAWPRVPLLQWKGEHCRTGQQ